MNREISALLSTFAKIEGKSKEEDGLFTVKDLEREAGMSNKQAYTVMRELVEAGIVEGGHRIIRKNMAGVMQRIPAYKRVKGGKE